MNKSESSKIDVSRSIDDLDVCLRTCPRQSTVAANALAILKRWQHDESLTQDCRERAGHLVREFA